MWRRSIISPVSTILLQENSFKPAFTSGLFFVCGVCMRIEICDGDTHPREQAKFCPTGVMPFNKTVNPANAGIQGTPAHTRSGFPPRE